MVVEVAVDDAVLKHAAERQREAAGRPGEPAGDDVVGAEQHHRAERHARRRRARCRAAAPIRKIPPRQRGGGDQRQDHGEGRAVGRDRERDQRDQRDALEAPQRVVGEDQKMHRQHGEAGEDVGQQDAGQPRQRGQAGQRRGDAEQHQRPAAEAQRAQQSASTQTVSAAWTTTTGQKSGCAKMFEEQAEHRRAARHQIAFEPAHQIAAGVVLQQRKPVPDRRREQDEGARNGGTDTR